MQNISMIDVSKNTSQCAPSTVDIDSIVNTREDQIGCDLAGEQVILDLNSGVYYGLNAVGSRIWQLIQTPTAVRKVRDAIIEEYDVDPERCERDLLALLRELANKELIEVKNGNGD